MPYWNTHNLQLWFQGTASHTSVNLVSSGTSQLESSQISRKHFCVHWSQNPSQKTQLWIKHTIDLICCKKKTLSSIRNRKQNNRKNRSLQRDVLQFPTCWWTVFWSPPIPKRWDRGSCWLWWLGHRGSSPQWSWFHFGSTNLAFSILGSLKALKKMSQLIRIYIKHSQIIIVDILIASISISINCLLRKLSPWKSTNLTVKRSPGHRCTCRFSLVPPGAEGRPCTSCFQCIVKGNKGGITASITGRVTTIHPGMYNDIHPKLTEQSYNDWRKWGFLSQLSLNWVSKPSIYKNFSEHIQCISVSQVQRKSQAFAQLMWRQFSLGCSK